MFYNIFDSAWSSQDSHSEVKETDDGWTIHVELPGVSKDRVKVTLESSSFDSRRQMLRIKVKDYADRFVVFNSGLFVEGIDAAMKDGLLTIKAHKKPKQVQEIEIK